MPAAPTRPERDTFGELPVPADALWGAQTQRSLEHFRISRERMPSELVLALVRVKRACARANVALGGLDARKSEAIVLAADEVLAGVHADQFPLSVWQTGSGTQTNMNVNEVLANRASELLGGVRGPTRIVHPNDDVNRSQSSNDVFPTAMHVALAVAHAERVGPACLALREALAAKAQTFADIVKIGRTHLQDAVPITLGQEFSGYVAQLDGARAALDATAPALNALALGGTAVGTGLNAPDGFGARVADLLAQDTALPFVSAANKFEALASHGPIVAYHGALKTLATALHKIANDIRWMASGPRSGLGELRIPENEPGSSIMPGKVNPTQAEALTMACARVLGNDTTIAFCDASGAFELNVYKPAIIDAALQSQRLMADAMDSFRAHCVVGIEPDRARIDALMRRSLMLVTALAPHIGYDRAAQIAKDAHARGVTLEEAAVASGWLTCEQFRAWVRPERMV